jgi:hypothetical protein
LDYTGGYDGMAELGERYRAWRGELDDVGFASGEAAMNEHDRHAEDRHQD